MRAFVEGWGRGDVYLGYGNLLICVTAAIGRNPRLQLLLTMQSGVSQRRSVMENPPGGSIPRNFAESSGWCADASLVVLFCGIISLSAQRCRPDEDETADDALSRLGLASPAASPVRGDPVRLVRGGGPSCASHGWNADAPSQILRRPLLLAASPRLALSSVCRPLRRSRPHPRR